MTSVETMAETRKALRSLILAAKSVLRDNYNSTYHLDKLDRWLEYGLKATGFTVGGKARLKHNIECTGGWKGYDNLLSKGREGTVYDIDIEDDGRVSVLFEPSEQWFTPDFTSDALGYVQGRPMPVKRPSCFWLFADHFESV